MATALRLPKGFYRKNFTTQTKIVFFGMLLMWLFSSGIMYVVFTDFSLAECLLLGAIITPTDPVVSSTIVSGDKATKYLPLYPLNPVLTMDWLSLSSSFTKLFYVQLLLTL